MSGSTFDIAFHYCVSHIPAATIPASRLSTILDGMYSGHLLSAHSLKYLQEQNLTGLYQLAIGQITYEAYIVRLDPSFVALQQTAKSEHTAKEAQQQAREAEYVSRKVTYQVDKEAQRKLHRQHEREASEAVLRAQRARQAEWAAQRERNREVAAAAYQALTNHPDYCAPNANDIAAYFHLIYIPSAVLPPLSGILDALFRGLRLTQDNLAFLRREAPSDLSKLAHGQITFDAYISAAEAMEAAETARIVRTEAAEAARIARECDPEYIAMMQRQALCDKYGIVVNSQSLLPRITDILRHIDAGNRLPAEDVVWLTTVAKMHFTEQLQKAYHQKEAEFYADEYRRTRDPWSAISASSHYRKCDQSGTALELLDSLESNRLKHPKLKSALCTTRGGVMRDLGQRSDALRLGEQAHGLQPRDFRPCTLLGAVHTELGDFDKGREWYDKAQERGASEQSIDTELRNIYQRANKASRESMKSYLLSADPNRYRWLNDKNYQGTFVADKL